MFTSFTSIINLTLFLMGLELPAPLNLRYWLTNYDDAIRFMEAIAPILVVAGVVLGFFLRWALRLRSIYNFSVKMATNHLPHIYHVQRKIAESLGIEIPDDPLIPEVKVNVAGK